MNLRKQTSHAAILIALATTNAAIANAESIVEDEVIAVGQYLYSDQVNALKSPTPIIDVPQSLSIVTADQIEQRGFTSISQIINYTAGVNNSQGEGHRDAIVFRGVRSTADFFIDGMRDDVQYYRPLYNLEQVEILRGPNALLFGRGGTGGVLNRVTKKGVIGESFTGYQIGVDTFGAFNAQIDANFDTGDTSAFRLNAMYESPDNHRDFYDGERIGINPTARIELTPMTTLDLSYEYVDHERFIDRGIPTGADGRPVEAFTGIVFGDPELNTSTLEAHILRASVQHTFSDNLKGNFSAFYGDYDKFYGNFYASGYDQAATPDQVTLDGYEDTTKRENLILSGNLIGEFETGRIGHTLITGVEIINTSSDQNRFNAFWDTTMDDNEIFDITRPLNLRGGVGVNASGLATRNDYTVDINDDTRVDIDVFSAYIQDEIALSDMLDLVVGLRFDSFDIDVFNVVANDQRSRKDEEISPRLGLIFKPQENIAIYGSYSESFLPRSGEQFANINGANDQLDPDVYESAEIGVKWDINPALSFTTAYFQVEETRAARDNTSGENFTVRGLEVDGFEMQLQGQVTEDLFITASYSYLDGETGSGAEPRELPENMFAVWGSYQLSDQIGFGLGATHQGESLITDGGSAVLPSFTRVDAAAYYDIRDDLRLQVNIENLTDETYFPNAHSTHQATVGAPLNARFAISGKF